MGYRITHCGSERKTEVFWLYSATHDYDLLYVAYCPKCRARSKTQSDDECRVIEVQGFSIEKGRLSRYCLKRKEHEEWLRRKEASLKQQEGKQDSEKPTRGQPIASDYTLAMSKGVDAFLHYLRKLTRLPKGVDCDKKTG